MTTHSAIRDGGRLHDYVDGLLSDTERAELAAHLGACEECRDDVSRLLALRARLAAAPRSIQPARDLWPRVRARIAARAVHQGEGLSRTPAGPTRHARWDGSTVVRTLAGLRRSTWHHARLAAAAVLLIVASSVVTVTLVRRGTARSVAQHDRALRGDVPSGGRDAERSSAAAVGAGYEHAVLDLASTLASRRAALSPETIAKVEASLRVIDSAIGEARTALARDPGNQALVELLSVSYRQKLDVLQRAAEFSTGI